MTNTMKASPKYNHEQEDTCASSGSSICYDATQRTRDAMTQHNGHGGGQKKTACTNKTNLRCEKLFVFLFQGRPLDLQLSQGFLHVGYLCGPGRQSESGCEIDRHERGATARAGRYIQIAQKWWCQERLKLPSHVSRIFRIYTAHEILHESLVNSPDGRAAPGSYTTTLLPHRLRAQHHEAV